MLRQDEQLLAGLGYKQEFKRDFRPLEVFGIAFSLIGLFPAAECVGLNISLSLTVQPRLLTAGRHLRFRCLMADRLL